MESEEYKLIFSLLHSMKYITTIYITHRIQFVSNNRENMLSMPCDKFSTIDGLKC